MSAKLVREYTSSQKRLSTSQGNMQLLSNSNVFIGWGSQPFISEFFYDGELLLEAHFPPDGESYRAFRSPWSGHPTEDPAVAVEQHPDDKVKLYASWSGATEVESWEVLAGPREGMGSYVLTGDRGSNNMRTGYKRGKLGDRQKGGNRHGRNNRATRRIRYPATQQVFTGGKVPRSA